jgi:catechol 2,3-dioxygenase-like lactoylglutathione lyase family enzyme
MIAVVPVTDPVRAKAFYGEVLSLRFVEDDGFALVFAGHHCSLRLVKMPEFKPAPFTLFGWEAANIEDEVRELLHAGVVFERYSFFTQDALGIWTAPNGSKVAWFKDPDGNTLSLSQHAYPAKA